MSRVISNSMISVSQGFMSVDWLMLNYDVVFFLILESSSQPKQIIKINLVNSAISVVQLLEKKKTMRLGDWTYPPRACGCSPELFFYLLSNCLHCDLGLLDGPLCCMKPAEVSKHKSTYRFFRIINILYSIWTKK